MTALCLSTVTRVGLGQVRMDGGFSLCAAPTSYCSLSILYVIRNSGPRVLRSDSARLSTRRRGRGMKGRGRGNLEWGKAQCYRVESTRHKQNRYSNCGNIHDTGSFIVWDEHSTCTRSEGTTKGTRTEHGRTRVHDTGVTTRLGMDG